MTHMTKSELIARLAARNPHLYQRDVERIVATVFDEISKALATGDRVELRGFGAFSVKKRDPRTGRNPRTGEQVAVASKRVPYFKTGKDLTCYNGSPDVDFAKAAIAFGVEGEVVSDPAKIQEALSRAKRANIEGRPYLLDVHVDREGVGAASEWYPGYSIADRRTRKV